MANHSATKKDVRQATKRRDRNRYYGKTTRNAIRDLKTIEEQKAYDEKLPNIVSQIDKLAKRGIIHKNKAANLKSKLAKHVAVAIAVKKK
jgi:small subunit ribosomal protein S20